MSGYLKSFKRSNNTNLISNYVLPATQNADDGGLEAINIISYTDINQTWFEQPMWKQIEAEDMQVYLNFK